MKLGLGRLADALRAPSLRGEPWAGISRAMHVVRMLVGASALAAAPLLPAVTPGERVAFTLLVGLGYLPYSVAVFLLSRGREGALARAASLAGDLLVVFVFQLLLPPTRFVSLLGYLLIVGVYSVLGGIRTGAVITASALALTLLAQWMEPSVRSVEGYTIAMWTAATFGLALLLDRLTREQRRALEQVDESQRQLAEAQELVHLGSWHWDVSTNVVSWSQEMFRIFGIEPTEFSATREGYRERVHPDDRVEVDRTVDGALASGGAFEIDHRIVRPGGTIRWVRGRARVVLAPDGRPVRMFGTAQDITGLYELERMKSEFVTGVSHELRTPLTSIKGFARTMLEHAAGLDEDARRDFLERIGRNADELQQLIEQLLDYSRFEMGWRDVRPEGIDLGVWVKGFVEGRAPALASHRIEVDVPPDLVAWADPDALKRILGNLLDNAVKFSPMGTRIGISAAGDEAGITIAVGDQGPGVPGDLLEAIFAPFTRGGTGEGSRRGTGMGLAVAKRYVDLHGGRIWVESGPGGATFRVALPSARHGPSTRRAS